MVSRDKRAAWLVRFALPYFCTTFSPPFGTGGISAAGSLKGKRRSRYTLLYYLLSGYFRATPTGHLRTIFTEAIAFGAPLGPVPSH